MITRTSSARSRGRRIAGCLVASLAADCGSTPVEPSLFRVAVGGAPGGAFLGVWVSPTEASAYLCGGYVGVDPTRVPSGGAGRLVGYREGRFTTLCRTPNVLWWVFSVEGAAFAVGEGGAVLRYTAARGCEPLEVGGDWPEGPPTFWGVWGRGANDLYLVGGSAAPTGPRGVLLHYDGARFERLAVPAAAAEVNLYKVAHGLGRTIVVGASGAVFSRTDGATGWEIDAVPSRDRDDNLFTVACAPDGAVCASVGGAETGRALLRTGAGWSALPLSDGLPGLNGVWVENERSLFMVGRNGVTLRYSGPGAITGTRLLTGDTFHAVAGSDHLVLAVGGEIGNTDPAQRGTILVRGASEERFFLDGRAYASTPTGRPAFGGPTGQ
ncbi:MAG: hypothetical protein IPF99_09440 [Deltaproteobacteria bacterium]|nr:hypothetical protein [Deltaproteobacteria bacterium]